MNYFIIDAAGPHDPQEAFLVCDQKWVELAVAYGAKVLSWGPTIWINGQVWCLSSGDLRMKRPGFFEGSVVYGVLATSKSKGYTGPDDLASIALWAGVDATDFEIAAPLGRCRLMAAIMRSPRLRNL